MKNIFTEHPHSIGETYLVHFKHALCMGSLMVLGGFGCLIHAIFPFIFPNTAKKFNLKVTKIFIERMPKNEPHLRALYQQMDQKYK